MQENYDKCYEHDRKAIKMEIVGRRLIPVCQSCIEDAEEVASRSGAAEPEFIDIPNGT